MGWPAKLFVDGQAKKIELRQENWTSPGPTREKKKRLKQLDISV